MCCPTPLLASVSVRRCGRRSSAFGSRHSASQRPMSRTCAWQRGGHARGGCCEQGAAGACERDARLSMHSVNTHAHTHTQHLTNTPAAAAAGRRPLAALTARCRAAAAG
jgi:hypothetical protein